MILVLFLMLWFLKLTSVLEKTFDKDEKYCQTVSESE